MVLKRILFLSLSIFSILGLNNSHAENAQNIRIISYGIYAHSPDNGKSWINPISDQAIKGKSSAPVHLVSSRKVPARYPLFFGFEYQIENLNDQLAEITTEVSHPRIKQSDGKFSSGYKETNKFLVVDGKITGINGYLLENKNETQPGEWVYTIKLKGKTIITQNFELVKE